MNTKQKNEHKAKKWFENLFAYGESQLSTLFCTRSYLCDELEEKGIFVPETSLKNHSEIFRVRNYKTKYFDIKKRESYNKNIKATGLKGIAIWKPVWEYLISNIPNAYVFCGKSLFVESKKDSSNHNGKPYFNPYLGGKVSSSIEFLKELYMGEERKDKQIKLLNRIVFLSLMFSTIPVIITLTFNQAVGMIASLLIVVNLLIWFILRNKKFKRFSFLTRRKIFERLFPTKRLLTDDIGSYLSSENRQLQMIEINLFSDDQVGALFHQRFRRDGLNPSYVQVMNSISLFTNNDNKSNCIIDKEESLNPVIFFEDDEVVVIPFEEIDNHPIMDHLLKYDIMKLDIPVIINDYVCKKLNIN